MWNPNNNNFPRCFGKHGMLQSGRLSSTLSSRSKLVTGCLGKHVTGYLLTRHSFRSSSDLASVLSSYATYRSFRFPLWVVLADESQELAVSAAFLGSFASGHLHVFLGLARSCVARRHI